MISTIKTTPKKECYKNFQLIQKKVRALQIARTLSSNTIF